MTERVLQLYEAMFLVEPGIATDWEAAKGMVQTIMDRAKAELLVCRLWDERRLSYPIKKQRRAAYIICYFRADGSTIGGIERDTQLSEHLLRVLVLRAGHITDEELEKIIAVPDRRLQPAAPAPAPRQAVPAAPVEQPLPKTVVDETDSSDPDQDDSDNSDGKDVADKSDDQ
ncbi:MAG: 30S ribosomal protein S6 [Actinobacteria bacterium]|nr:30S ribosomal protein S6 [Actinomycetota bacterium]